MPPPTSGSARRSSTRGARHEALAPLELAARAELAPADAFYHLGRCLLALDRPADAVPALQRALQLGEAARVGDTQIAGIHYQLGRALRATGATEESADHFAEAERLVSNRAEASREQMARYLADIPDPEAPAGLPAHRHVVPAGAVAGRRARRGAGARSRRRLPART